MRYKGWFVAKFVAIFIAKTHAFIAKLYCWPVAFCCFYINESFDNVWKTQRNGEKPRKSAVHLDGAFGRG